MDEILTGVSIGLGSASIDSCEAFDTNGDSTVTVDEIIGALNRALNGCAMQ